MAQSCHSLIAGLSAALGVVKSGRQTSELLKWYRLAQISILRRGVVLKWVWQADQIRGPVRDWPQDPMPSPAASQQPHLRLDPFGPRVWHTVDTEAVRDHFYTSFFKMVAQLTERSQVLRTGLRLGPFQDTQHLVLLLAMRQLQDWVSEAGCRQRDLCNHG
jgi:hypothetical protein